MQIISVEYNVLIYWCVTVKNCISVRYLGPEYKKCGFSVVASHADIDSGGDGDSNDMYRVWQSKILWHCKCSYWLMNNRKLNECLIPNHLLVTFLVCDKYPPQTI